MKKNLQLTIVISFTVFLAVFAALFLILPDREFSDLENRYLAAPPKFTAQSLINGKFTASFETYVSDQFPFRTFWVGAKSLTELALLKTENNDVYFGRDGFLSERFTVSDFSVADANIEAVNSFVDKVDVPVYLALIPGSGEIWSGKLPQNAINANQTDIIAYFYANFVSEINTINLNFVLNRHADEEIFFRTDHHWTPLGARYAAEAIATALDLPLPPRPPETLLTPEFRGTAYNSSAAWWVKPDEIKAYMSDSPVTAINYNAGSAESVSLYYPEYLTKSGKYQYFLGGNSPNRVIKSDLEGAKILLVRDSFSDVLAPQFIDSVSEIHLLDLRYYKGSVAEYTEQNGIDKVIILYSTKNFCEDKNVSLIAY